MITNEGTRWCVCERLFLIDGEEEGPRHKYLRDDDDDDDE